MEPTAGVMREVKRAGYPVYGLSNWSTESFPWVQHKYTFLSELDDFLLSGMVGIAKPDERIFHAFLQRIDRPAEECVFIDDSQANIDVANRLGFAGILFRSALQLRAELVALGVLNGKQT
jgi:2-haloacid dehalogenase